MGSTEPQRSQATEQPERPAWRMLLNRLAIWGLFLLVLYLGRDFFFTGFMTFLFCYLTLSLVGRLMKRLSPDRERPLLRRLLTVGVFVLAPLLLLGAGFLVGPRLVEQGQQLAGWATHVTLETEAARLLEDWVGPSEFRRQYGSPDDPRYHEGLEAFRVSGISHVKAYQDFPAMEAWLEAGFSKQFIEQQTNKIRVRLLREGTSSKAFASWFLADKAPELQAQARREVPDKGRAPESVDLLVRAAAQASPAQLLNQARHDPAVLSKLRQEWVADTVKRELTAAKGSPTYLEEFHAYYDAKAERSPSLVPYTFEEYVELQKARQGGAKPFSDAFEKLKPTASDQSEERLRADFEAASKHELFRRWWGTNPIARFVRRHLEANPTAGSDSFDHYLASLINLPMSLGTALLLSLFICIDFPNLQQGMRKLRQTWLREVYDEMAPSFTSLGELIGRALHAQGLIALCNAVMMFAALSVLGVEHAVLLSVAVFVLCLVPTLGILIAWALVGVVALVQPGGGLSLVLKVSAAVLVISLVETFVLSPRIMGRMMEVHPVLIVALLPIAQYFFGIWGLILATPVAVFVIYQLIFGKELPGHKAEAASAPGKE